MTTQVAQTNRAVDAEGLAMVFKALGSPVRLRLLAVMQARSDGAACVCDLVSHVSMAQSTVSHHLRILVAAGLIRREQRGTWTWYALVPERLDTVRELLANPGSTLERDCSI